jgi:hypothetical protein
MVRVSRSRFQRSAAVGAVMVSAVVIASCRGYTTVATDIVEQPSGAYSAQLNFVGSCGAGEHCSFYVRYRRIGTSAWAHEPGAPRGPIAGPVAKHSLAQVVTGLTTRVQYEYQVCGNAQPGRPFACVGPDGTSNTTTKFTTPSQRRPTVTAVDDGKGYGGLLFDDGSTVTISGTGFSTAPRATTFDFGGAIPTDVACLSTTQCKMTTPTPYPTIRLTSSRPSTDWTHCRTRPTTKRSTSAFRAASAEATADALTGEGEQRACVSMPVPPPGCDRSGWDRRGADGLVCGLYDGGNEHRPADRQVIFGTSELRRVLRYWRALLMVRTVSAGRYHGLVAHAGDATRSFRRTRCEAFARGGGDGS